MNTGGLVALVAALKENLLAIVNSVPTTSTSYGKRISESGHSFARNTVLAVGTDYYASPSTMAYNNIESKFASENLRVDVSVAVFRLIEEMYMACKTSVKVSTITENAIASIGLETKIIQTLAVGYISNTQMRLDARYSAAQVAARIALPYFEEEHDEISSKGEMMNDMQILLSAFLDVLHDANFNDFRND